MPSAKLLTDTNAATLETTLNTFLGSVTTLVSTQYASMFTKFSGGVAVLEYSVLVIYT